MIEEDDQHERKKSRDTSRANSTDLQRSKKVALLAKSWRDAQLTQLRKLSWAAQKPHIVVTCRGHASCLEWSALEMGRVITVQTLWVKCRCQLVVSLKANKYYQELLCSLSSYINFLNLLNLQVLHGWLLAPGRFQTSSLWSRHLTNSDLKEDAYTCAHVRSIVWSIVQSADCDPTALRWDVCFFVIWLLLDELLDLGRSVGQWFLVVCSCESSCPLALLHNRFWLSLASPNSCLSGLLGNRAQLWSVGGLIGWSIVGLINWLFQLVLT